MFIFDEKCQNYIQVLGNNFKSVMTKLISVPRIEKSNNNFYFTKVFTSVANSTFYTQSQYQNKSNLILNDINFTVERTKIYYCSNFNRKLGFFKNLKIIPIPMEKFDSTMNALEKMWTNNNTNNYYNKKNKNNNINNKQKNKMNKNSINDNYNGNNSNNNHISIGELNNNFVSITFNKLFTKVSPLLPIEVEIKIYYFFNYIAIKINNFNYPKELFKLVAYFLI